MTKRQSHHRSDSDCFDAVMDFDYSTQSDEYNKSFIQWRKDKKNLYAYNYSENKNEKIFVEGMGFLNNSAAKAESRTLYKILRVIGVSLIISILIDDLLDKIIVLLLDFAGADIHISLTNSFMYGAKMPVVLVMMFTDMLKIAVPLAYASRKFNMPKNVSCPRKVNHPMEIATASAIVMMVAAILSLLDVYSEESREIYTFLKSVDSNVSLWHQKEFVLYIIFDVLVVTVAAEIMYRGLFLAVLRQFGDVYAVIITSLLCGIMTHNFGIMPGITIVSVVSAIGVLRSGSVYTAIYSKILYELFFLSMPFFSDKMSGKGELALALGAFVLGLILFIAMYMLKNLRTKKTFAGYNAQLTMRTKFKLALDCYPIMIIVIFGLVMAFIE